MAMQINSRDNPKIKLLRSLRQRKSRQATGLFLVEGIRHVGEAAEAAWKASPAPQVELVCYAPDLLTSSYALSLVDNCLAAGIPTYPVAADIFESLADKDNPQGILAAVRPPAWSLESLAPDSHPWLVALVAPQDPGNIGSILRTIDAVGASGLILLENSADPYQPGAVRASMGSIFWYPLVAGISFEAFAAWARRGGYSLVGTSAKGSVDYRAAREYNFPLSLVMGSEREGLAPAQAAACDVLVKLPMLGRVTSLNLAVATGVMMYELLGSRG
jgi:TrmH family RNA methyltransferase